MNQTASTPAIAIGIDDAAKAIGIARSAMYGLVAQGEIDSFKIGRRRLILTKTLEAFTTRMAKEGAR